MPEERRLRRMLAEQFALDETTLERDTLLDDLNLDSLEILELLTAIEDEYDIQLDAREFADCENLGDMADLIIDKVRN